MGQLQMGPTDVAKLDYVTGTGNVITGDGGLWLALDECDGQRYSDAQVDDYHSSGILRWRPPVHMKLRARFSHAQATLLGTAGFGFWNDPFGMTPVGRRKAHLPRIRLPMALWFFFASPPSNMALAMDVPGFGWKAATIDASGVVAKMLLPFAPLGMLACHWSWGYRRLWPLAQRVLKIDEMALPVPMEEWHDYRLEWERQGVRFFVDERLVMQTPYAPRGPLGFVAWIDNQFMVATPQGRFRHGLVATREQWLEIANLEVVAN